MFTYLLRREQDVRKTYKTWKYFSLQASCGYSINVYATELHIITVVVIIIISIIITINV